MITELFIARRIQLNTKEKGINSSPSHVIAMVGITLAIVIMILSLAIVSGFKDEIANKIYSLDSHIRVSNAALGLDDNPFTINSKDVIPQIKNAISPELVSEVSLIAEQPVIIKTPDDFKGIVFKGVDENYNWDYISSTITEGRLPDYNKSDEIAISQSVASKMKIKVGDRIFMYFCNQKIKTRRATVAGIFNTDFEEFDSNFILGSISLLQGVNGWTADTGSYVSIDLCDTKDISAVSYLLYSKLAQDSYESGNETIYNVTNTTQYNASYFSWLSLLDMNVLIIISLMAVVSAFTLISALLMIVLERIKMIGLLKTLGADNSGIRRIFILLTQKIIVKSIVAGNVIGISLALLQKYLHIVKLDSEAYYMSYVPIETDWISLIVLNVCIFIVAYITLIGPSHIISSIKPSTTLRYE